MLRQPGTRRPSYSPILRRGQQDSSHPGPNVAHHGIRQGHAGQQSHSPRHHTAQRPIDHLRHGEAVDRYTPGCRLTSVRNLVFVRPSPGAEGPHLANLVCVWCRRGVVTLPGSTRQRISAVCFGETYRSYTLAVSPMSQCRRVALSHPVWNHLPPLSCRLSWDIRPHSHLVERRLSLDPSSRCISTFLSV